jgi:hypothetical protein
VKTVDSDKKAIDKSTHLKKTVILKAGQRVGLRKPEGSTPG